MLGIQASFGVDIYKRSDHLTEREFVERVDAFLYLAKGEGRNRVCHAPYAKEDEVPVDEIEALIGEIDKDK